MLKGLDDRPTLNYRSTGTAQEETRRQRNDFWRETRGHFLGCLLACGIIVVGTALILLLFRLFVMPSQ